MPHKENMHITKTIAQAGECPANGFQPATGADLALLVTRMRPACSAECRAVNGHEPLASLTADRENTSIFIGKQGLPSAAISVAPAGGNDCAILFRFAIDINENTVTFMPTVAKFCDELHGRYSAIHALVDARNVYTSRLVHECGFAFIERFNEFGVQERPFNLFTFQRRPSQH